MRMKTSQQVIEDLQTRIYIRLWLYRGSLIGPQMFDRVGVDEDKETRERLKKWLKEHKNQA